MNTHTHGRQLQITYLDVLDYSEYSVLFQTFFSRKHVNFLREGEAHKIP